MLTLSVAIKSEKIYYQFEQKKEKYLTFGFEEDCLSLGMKVANVKS